jgi:hypothetical protein
MYRRRVLRTFQRAVDFLFVLCTYFTARILLYRPHITLPPAPINVGPETHVHKITNVPVFYMERDVMEL